MKGFSLVAALLLIGAHPALAQDRLVRGDVSGTLGWLSASTGEVDRYEDWSNSILLTEAGAGWYWTRHLKTEFTVGITTETTSYGAVTVEMGGRPYFAPSTSTFSSRRITAIQQYQFRDNEWFHPYVGAGVDVVWRRSSRRDEALFDYDSVTRQSRMLRGVVVYPERTDVRTLPVLSGGFKAYLTPRAFFRGDLKVGFDREPDEVALRFGFGVDF